MLKVISGHPSDPLHLEVEGQRAPQHLDRQPSPHIPLGCVGPPMGAGTDVVVDTTSPPHGQPPAPTSDILITAWDNRDYTGENPIRMGMP